MIGGKSMASLFQSQEKQILTGNILFIVCCVFYLAWWLLAFKPVGAIKGMKTGWLLIPAAFAGLSGVILILQSILSKTQANHLLPGSFILWGGIAAYIILLTVTVLLFKRPPTSELVLIVGWGMLALAEINLLFGLGVFSRRMSASFFLLIGAVVVLSLVCYVLYYHLEENAGYIDGMIPLLLVALVMGSVSCFIL
jgi:hypothetical protein